MEQVATETKKGYRLPAVTPWSVTCLVFLLAATSLFLVNLARFANDTQRAMRLIPYLRYDLREDFGYFYAGATLALHGDAADLYPFPGEWTYYPRDAIFEDVRDDYANARLLARGNYYNPPALAFLQAPLAALDFRAAYWLYSSLALAALAGFLLVAWRSGPSIPEMPLFVLGVLAFRPVHELLIMGHVSLFLVLSLASGLLLLRADRQVLAGLVLSTLALKPQWAVLPGLFLLVRGRWPALVTMGVASAAIFFVPFLFTGVQTFENYYHFLRFTADLDLKDAPHMFSWNGFLGRLNGAEVQNGQIVYFADAPSRALVFGLIGLTALPVLTVWWGRDYLLGAAATVVAMLLVSTHSVWYDWAILTVAALFLVLRSPSLPRGQRVEMWLLLLAVSLAASQSIGAIIGDNRHDITPLDWHSVQFFSLTPVSFLLLLWMASVALRAGQLRPPDLKAMALRLARR